MGKRLGASTKRNTGFSLLMPLIILLLLILINMSIGLFNGTGFFSFVKIELTVNSAGNTILGGQIINVLFGASELVILAIGMTLVTSASGGQDISVGAVASLAAAVFVQVLYILGSPPTWTSILIAFLASSVVAMLCGAFNGMLVAVFKIQPMIATLILFTSARSIAYAINGVASPLLADSLTQQIGGFFSGVPIQTVIFIVIFVIFVFCLIFKVTNLRLYTEAVGINEKSARLNGINPIKIKWMVYVILGLCVAIAGIMRTCKSQRLEHNGILNGIEMDAILAVAIGGNALSGGKFSITGSIIGAYTIELLTRTLLKAEIKAEAIKAYKAIFIIILMVASSPVVREFVGKWWKKLTDRARNRSKEGIPAAKEEV